MTITDIGLLFDALGVLILGYTGIDNVFWQNERYPKMTNLTKGTTYILKDQTPGNIDKNPIWEPEKEYVKHRKMQRFGFGMILIGFIFQFSFVQILF